MFRRLRILLLLLVLVTVALGAWRANTRLVAWEHTIHVGIYPIAADDSPQTSAFLRELKDEDFLPLAQWVEKESHRYGQTVLKPVALRAAPVMTAQPPATPSRPGVFEAMLWSLKLRWWAARHDKIDGPKPQVRLFVLFHDPEKTPRLPHSTGLDKGQIGVIHAFASPRQKNQNAVVIAHELLHTFGASDKYDLATGQPLYPQGYAEPGRAPLHPQEKAEIMGGRIPTSEQRSEIPASLADTLIGPQTAREIGLLRDPPDPGGQAKR